MRKHRFIDAVAFGLILALLPQLLARSAPAQANGDVTVYVTKTGKKYHAASCRYIRKGATPMKLKDAVKEGYSPCSVCKPPTLEKQPQGSAPRG